MTRADLRPLPKESEKQIEWVRARHEVKIRKALRNWRREKVMVVVPPNAADTVPL